MNTIWPKIGIRLKRILRDFANNFRFINSSKRLLIKSKFILKAFVLNQGKLFEALIYVDNLIILLQKHDKETPCSFHLKPSFIAWTIRGHYLGVILY